MKNILKVKWICQVIQNSTKRLKDWSNKVFGETIILKQKNLGKWNKLKNKIKILSRIKFNITHRRRKENVRTHTVTKIKILKIKMWKITRINSKNLKNKAIIMNLLTIKKTMQINPFNNKFQIKTKMRLLWTQNHKLQTSQRIHFWMALNTKTNKSTKTAATNLKETRTS